MMSFISKISEVASGILSSVTKRKKTPFSPSNELEVELAGYLADERRKAHFLKNFMMTEVLVLGANKLENGYKNLVFDKFNRGDEKCVNAFTSKDSFRRYIESKGGLTPSYMKVMPIDLAEMIRGRAGLMINQETELSFYLTASELDQIVSEYNLELIADNSQKRNEDKKEIPESMSLFRILNSYLQRKQTLYDIKFGFLDSDKNDEVMIVLIFNGLAEDDHKEEAFRDLQLAASSILPDNCKIIFREFCESITWISSSNSGTLTSVKEKASLGKPAA
ncbi:MAG: SseB family protein [Proteobacteria bacterium]|nr:MAG: SseB family protein [Pseudomonadota bacterium]